MNLLNHDTLTNLDIIKFYILTTFKTTLNIIDDCIS